MTLAAYIDVRERRIPNWLNLLIILSGIAQSFFATRLVGPGMSVLGLFVGATIPFVLFAIGALGAGDVKLMAGVGAWVGPVPALMVFVVEKVVGLIIVLTQAAIQGRTRLLFRNSALVAMNLVHIKELGVEHVSATGRSTRTVDRPLPYAVPALIAVLLVLARKWA